MTHNWVLIEVIVSASGYGVELHQVVKVCDFSFHPFLSEARFLQQFGWLSDPHSVQVLRPQVNDCAVHTVHDLQGRREGHQ